MKRTLSLMLLLCAPIARAANWPERPVLTAVRASAPVRIDGDLSDPAWQAAPEFTDFTQHDPNDGEPATMRTSVRVLYDDEAIYFGAMMEDPEAPTALLARRDTFLQSDFLSINIDPQHDRLSGSAFTVTPSNMQIDSILFNDVGEDGSWDGVWDSTAKIVANGWVAEVRVPFSQLRFPDKPVHTWGLNITRRTVRRNEWVRIVNTRKGETGFVSHFADLVGLEGIHRERPLEVLPYVVGRSDILTRADRENPFLDSREHRLDGGLDLKYALSSTLTLTGTINPDFGQVEVDPAVVNLSQFETFYPEKRPFFTEGLNIFAFGDSPARSHFAFTDLPRIFYSRRIGRSPQAGIDADFVAGPSETTILGAAKVTGKLGKWSIGVLDALTDVERARFSGFEGTGRRQVEPMSNYFVSRLTREIGSGSRVGMLLTSVDRRLPDELEGLREHALTAAMDGYTSSADKNWIFEWYAAGTRVAGSELAILRTQRSPGHYYQRPDADHVEFDPTRTSLSGYAGKAMVSKQNGLWRPNVQVVAFSPGYETNDIGFMPRADMISTHALVQYVNEELTDHFRQRNVWMGVWNTDNFDGDNLERGAFVDMFGTAQNYWEYRAALYLLPSAWDDRLTRGGPVVAKPSAWSLETSVSTDERKTFWTEIEGQFDRTDDTSYEREGTLTVNYRPSPNLLLSVAPYYGRTHEQRQYVTAVPDPDATSTYGQRYIFAELEQRVFELGTRLDWTLNPRLSFQLYVQPFIASGDFHDPSELVSPRGGDYAPYDGIVPDLDFNLRSVRGSAVARWEFRRGSALYVVWNENRAEAVSDGRFRFGQDLRAIPNAPSHDVILIKLSYWLPL